METHKYVAGLLFSQNRSMVALILKTKPEWQAGKLNAIGGKIEPGESSEQAMVREFREEAGVYVDTWNFFCEMRGPDWFVHFFVAEADIEIQTMTDEIVGWYHPNYAISQMYGATVDDLYWLVPLALRALDKPNMMAEVEFP